MSVAKSGRFRSIDVAKEKFNSKAMLYLAAVRIFYKNSSSL